MRASEFRSRAAARPVVLVIGGTHPGASAGLAADLATLHALRVSPRLAVSAVTAQDSGGVRAVAPVAARLVRAQLASVWRDGPPAAVKIGLVADAAGARCLARWFAAHPGVPVVLDPVLAATTGQRLTQAGLRAALLRELLPRAALITPNHAEARILTGLPLRTHAEVEAAARHLVAAGARAALIKGGHFAAEPGADYLWDGRRGLWLHTRLRGRRPLRGTGCRLASAIAAGLARGLPLAASVRRAKRWLTLQLTLPGESLIIRPPFLRAVSSGRGT